MRVFECFENLEEKIAQIQELIDIEEVERKEKKREDKDEDYKEEDTEDEDSEESNDDYEEEKIEVEDRTISLGKKRSHDVNSDDVTTTSHKCIKTSDVSSKKEAKGSNYDTLTLAELKDICKERKLSVTGRKAELVERCAHDGGDIVTKTTQKQKTTKRTKKRSWTESCVLA